MRQARFAFFCIFVAAATVSVRAQVVPAATATGFSLTAGALGSAFQPDYAGLGIAHTSPNRLYGVGAFVDARFTRWVQVEGEWHQLHFNDEYNLGNAVEKNGEDTYLVGPRLPIGTFHRFTPYGKFLVGIGTADFLDGSAFVLNYGGGLDYHLGRRLALRGDFEYQQLRVTPVISPYGVSAGVSYRIF